MANDDWTQPGVYEVVPGVHRIPLPLPNDGLRAVNVYAVTGPDGPTLVDSGWAIPVGLELLEKGLAELGSEFADITRFLITHMHRDHYSQAIHLRREFGTTVALGAEERWSLEAVSRPGRMAAQEQVELLRALGATEIAEAMSGKKPHHDPAEWELPDEWLTGDQTIAANGRSLEVVETPGHTDEDEFLDIVEVSLEDAVGKIGSGEIRDAKSISGLLFVERMQRTGQLS